MVSIGVSKGGDGVGLWKNDGRGDQCLKMTGVSGRDGEGLGVGGMDERERLGVRLSKGSGDMVTL